MFDNFFDRLNTAFLEGDGYQLMLDGLGNTVLIALCALLIGVFIGTLAAVCKVLPKEYILSRVLSFIAEIYIAVIRGTPVMVQLLLIYFGVAPTLGFSEALPIAIFVFGINSSAYVAEIIRSGIMAVDRGQMEAGRSLGLSYTTSMFRIVFPQAIKNILPALGNEFIVLIKETSVAGFITVFDLTRAARAIVADTYDPFVPYLVLAAVYLVLVMIATLLVHQLERRLRRSDYR